MTATVYATAPRRGVMTYATTPTGTVTQIVEPAEPLVDHRAVAALALGLAYSHLDRGDSVAELATSADAALLRRAHHHLAGLDHHTPAVLASARKLVEAAVHVRTRPERAIA
ncbi:hypothetical protein [Egicoccus sp. AB-alg2]|uniref:hypothetical protein n=1 Tax=Egicoccus sp. AB-alg2 TaxID=3242693 RepID=UPI00359DF936